MEFVKTRVLYLFFLLFFLFMAHRIFFVSSGMIERTSSCVAYPFLKAKSLISYPFSKFFLFFQQVDALEQKLKELKEDKENVQARLIEVESCLDFKKQIKELSDYAKRYKCEDKQLVQVLLCSISEVEDTVLIDAGFDKAVKKDDVLLYKNMLIGRVIEVYPWYSKAVLISDKRCKVSAQCKKEVSGICCGKNNGKLEFNFVPHFKDVKLGDILTSTGRGLVYPKGYGLGEVISIETDNVSHFIQVQLLLDFKDIDYLYLLSR